MSFEYQRLQADHTTPLGACQQIVNFLLETIPELTKVGETVKSSGKTSTSVLADSYTKWEDFLEFDGCGYGLYVYQYLRSDYDDGALTGSFGLGLCSIDAGKGTLESTMASVTFPYVTQGDARHFQQTVDVIRVDGRYVIRFGAVAYYLGFLDSAIVGKILLFSRMEGILAHNVASWPTGYSTYSDAAVVEQATFFTAYLGQIAPDLTNRPASTAILSPIYVTLSGQCMEPLVLPGIYHFCGGTNPGYDNIVEAAGVEVLQVNSVPVVVARPKV